MFSLGMVEILFGGANVKLTDGAHLRRVERKVGHLELGEAKLHNRPFAVLGEPLR